MLLNQDSSKIIISIQVSLNGYSLHGVVGDASFFRGWSSLDRFCDENQDLINSKISELNISLFTPKFTLVPDICFDKSKLRDHLADVVLLDDNDVIESLFIPDLSLYLVYSKSNLIEESKRVMSYLNIAADNVSVYPEIYYLLNKLKDCCTYNKIFASYRDGYLYLVVAQGEKLLLCNSYEAADFTTAEYFIFLVMKSLQLNPEVSVIHFNTPLNEDERMSLYRYFRSVE